VLFRRDEDPPLALQEVHTRAAVVNVRMTGPWDI